MDHNPTTPQPRKKLSRRAMLGAGGIMDANDPLELGPIRLITEPELSPDNPDNPTHTAGVTFVGQFLDQDITRDVGSRLASARHSRCGAASTFARLVSIWTPCTAEGPTRCLSSMRTTTPSCFASNPADASKTSRAAAMAAPSCATTAMTRT